ncbi:hypothetical protein DIS24_g9626 [Lasiodiplodia hormozganensis]|uniref:NWD NACHT-NTPase N-terminal domain-containing protein n=1 Tax=Lasiodiplodia hormozganensis TaxID=869390 RepID=A0AA39XTW6_9PEZI|nr:hypothetical protein DIS24_g9626 [Lasiodiplodia hormozganensis]
MATLVDPPPNSINNARTDGCQKAAEDLWNQAIQNLSKDDQQRLASLRNDKLDILNSVLNEVEIKKQRCLDKRWTYKGRDGKPKVLRDLCDKTIAWVTRFKALGDTFVKFDVSGQAAIPWAGVAFLLQVASNESQIFGRMLEGVERVSFLITRYALVEHVYFSPSGGSDALMDHVNGDEKSALKRDMVMLYSSILRFLAKASGYYSGNTASWYSNHIMVSQGVNVVVTERIAKSFIETPESSVDDSFDEITSKEDEISRTQQLLQQSSLNLLYEQGSDTRLAVENLRALEDPINRVAAQLSDIQDRLNGECILAASDTAGNADEE